MGCSKLLLYCAYLSCFRFRICKCAYLSCSPIPPLSTLTSRATHAHPTSPRSTGFCAIWDCISSSLKYRASDFVSVNIFLPLPIPPLPSPCLGGVIFFTELEVMAAAPLVPGPVGGISLPACVLWTYPRAFKAHPRHANKQAPKALEGRCVTAEPMQWPT